MTNPRLPLQGSDDQAQWQDLCHTKLSAVTVLVTRATNMHRKAQSCCPLRPRKRPQKTGISIAFFANVRPQPGPEPRTVTNHRTNSNLGPQGRKAPNLRATPPPGPAREAPSGSCWRRRQIACPPCQAATTRRSTGCRPRRRRAGKGERRCRASSRHGGPTVEHRPAHQRTSQVAERRSLDREAPRRDRRGRGERRQWWRRAGDSEGAIGRLLEGGNDVLSVG